MTDAALALPERMTLAEFLTWDDGTDRRYELVDGIVTAMTPPASVHSFLTGALASALAGKLRKGYRLFIEAGLRPGDNADTYFQADLAVSCAAQAWREHFIREPQVIVEVISPSTATHDRGTKIPGYRTIGSVQEIVLFYSESIRAELWRRSEEGWSVIDLIGRDTVLRLESLGVELSLDEVYAGIDFTAQENAAQSE